MSSSSSTSSSASLLENECSVICEILKSIGMSFDDLSEQARSSLSDLARSAIIFGTNDAEPTTSIAPAFLSLSVQHANVTRDLKSQEVISSALKEELQKQEASLASFRTLATNLEQQYLLVDQQSIKDKAVTAYCSAKSPEYLSEVADIKKKVSSLRTTTHIYSYLNSLKRLGTLKILAVTP